MSPTRCLSVLGVAVGLLVSANARGDDPTKRQCIDANVQAQKQQKDGKLRAAQTSLQLCGSPACPAAVRNDCTQLLDDLMKRLPTLVFEARTAAGADLTAVSVFVDGQPLADKLDGTALPVDPGEHSFRFESPRLAPVTTKLVIREGDRARRERITFAAAPAPVPAAPVPVAPVPVAPVPVAPVPVAPVTPPTPEQPKSTQVPSTTSSSSTSTLRYVGIAATGVGVVGVGLGVIFGLRAKSKLDDSRTDPDGTGCNAQDFCGATGKALRSDAQSAATISTIGFIGGGVLLATGLGLVIFAPSDKKSTTASLTPLLGNGTGGAVLRGKF